MIAVGRIIRSIGLVLVLVGELVGQQFSYDNTSIISVIKDIEERTPYRFLYREAMLTGLTLSFDSDEKTLFDEFSSAIKSSQLAIKVDQDRHQALIYKSGDPSNKKVVQISGFVVDGNTGERLPFATISWREFGFIDGMTTSTNGQFDIQLTADQSDLTLLVSYVGYTSEQVEFDLDQTSEWKGVTVRLQPKPFSGKEIIVQGINFYTPNDTVLHGLMKVGSFSPLGESNAVRSLQMLPAVSMSAAVTDGINIRGSSSDGFQVLLDGQTVYNQSHLFGLLDAMNSDVLKSSGFYYDVTPAQYQAPLGGTLSLITRTGSLNDLRGSVGVSNTALKSTLEGPLVKGKSSWLLSGRISYLDEINWFSNSEMIEYGLDVNRPVDLFVDPRLQGRVIQDISLDEIEVQNTEASFHDVHGKIYFETESGSQFILSGYLGRDEASQLYLRDETNFISTNITTNYWNNASITGQFNTLFENGFIFNARAGYTAYSSEYYKDDFEFPVVRNQDGEVRFDSVLVQPLDLENDIYQFDFAQSFSKSFTQGHLEFGLSYSNFDVRYREIGLSDASFFSRRTSQLVDLYQQLDIKASKKTDLSLGNRLHYFSNGEYLRWSPRIKLSYKIEDNLSIGTGFSRNYQFMNRLEFYNINSNDFWILANEDQPPSAVNYLSAGIYYNILDGLYVQLEGYLKDYENLRIHELDTRFISVSFQNRQVPWFYENDGRSSGLEALLKNRFRDVTLSTAYTLSKTELRNDRINNGAYFYASWDRRHQISSVAEVDLKGGFSLLTSWTYGSGAPSRADFTNSDLQTERLPSYSRFDVSFSYKSILQFGSLDASFSIYNAFDRKNPWYSERKQITVTTRNNQFQGSALTHVYDLGIQPSFSLKFNF